MPEVYDKDYFERGLITGKSCFENYRWLPELTIPMAMTIIDHLNIGINSKILDFGCSKGFLVKAFRWLKRRAWGYDISKYAISNADNEIKEYVSNKFWKMEFTHCIAKDVFEHIPEKNIPDELKRIISESLFAIIPLGDNGEYVAPNNNMDPTHVTCHTAEWWGTFFENCGWKVDSFQYRLDGIKDHYYEKYPNAHGFFKLIRG